MNFWKNIFALIIALSIFGCTKQWGEHYKVQSETVDKNIWEGIQADTSLSVFVNIVRDFKYDTLFLNTDYTYTVFAPDNEALNTFLETHTFTDTILNFLISEEYVQSGVVPGGKKILTIGGKYALLERNGNSVKMEGIKIEDESPLYRNGRFFKMQDVAIPKPNIYEYIALNNPILKMYIDRQESVMMDFDKSRVIGFDEFGNTIWDTVLKITNLFEEKYFPVKHEFRNKTATFVFPKLDSYNDALTLLAENISGSNYDYNDIPFSWQEIVLIPTVLTNGVFEHSLEENEFTKRYGKSYVKLKNIFGDSVAVYYTPVEKMVCSNGYVYSYSDFSISNSLFFNKAERFEAESLLKESDIKGKYDWDKGVSVISDNKFQPEFFKDMQGISMKVIFPIKYDPFGKPILYSGKFILDFKAMRLFPRKYLMIVKTFYDIGGFYEVYVNDKLVKVIDYGDYQIYKGIYYSVVKGERVNSVNGYNVFDCYIDNITDYNEVRIRFEYKGPGGAPIQGLAIDYIEFVPLDIFQGYKNYKL